MEVEINSYIKWNAPCLERQLWKVSSYMCGVCGVLVYKSWKYKGPITPQGETLRDKSEDKEKAM